ncbi:alternative ribosome rescue aminoacyl-tRNA hydrolase ArfB [Mucilaginibacter koreensis]
MQIDKAALQKEITYKTSRSGGKGGQNVNKVASKVELLFSITQSTLFDDRDKEWLLQQLATRINAGGNLQVICDEERSQYLNKQKALDRLYVLLTKALYRPKVRKATKPSKAAKARRVEQKRVNAVKKQLRKANFDF